MKRVVHRSLILYGLPFFIFLFFCNILSAQADQPPADENAKITFEGSNVTLRTVFKAIKAQSGFTMMFAKDISGIDGDEKVTVSFKGMPLPEVLNALFKGKNLEWKVSDNVLVIRKKETVLFKKNEGDSSVTTFNLTGKVTDASGNEIPGATIMVKGTQQGAISDADGNFQLPNVTKKAILIVSSVGYEPREIVVSGRTILAQLSVDVNKLDETVVVAYGTTTRRFSTGNIGSIKADIIEKQPVSNPLLALQGRIPGLFMQQNNGMSGGAVTVRIQGQNSIANGNAPFYVVDGVPYSSQTLSTTTGGSYNILGNSNDGPGSGSGNPFSFLNPSDIESIEILKDADATAIYGSRAANGAILITTKKGKAGLTKLDLNIQQGWGKVTRKMKLLNTPQYLQMRHEALKNDSASIDLPDFDLNGLWDTTRYTDWQKELIGGTAQYTNIGLTVSGGTVNTQYLIGGNLRRESSVFPGDFSDRKGSLHFNINSSSNNQKFHIQLSGNYLAGKNELPYIDLTTNALQLAPVAPAIYNEDGTLNWQPYDGVNSSWDNPLAFTLVRYQNKSTNLVSNLTLSYKLFPGLEIKSSFGLSKLLIDEFQGTPLISQRPEYRPYATGTARYSHSDRNTWIVEPQIIYNRNIGKGKLNVLFGGTIQQNNSSGEVFEASGFNSDAVLEDIRSAAAVEVVGSTNALYKYSALFSRINYVHLNKYIINLTARRDGSSRFGVKNQFHNFGAAGIAWIFSEEPFVKKLLPFVSFGKIRGSYGVTGNDQIDDYRTLNLYTPNNSGVPYQNIPSLIPRGLANPYLQWEQTRKLQMGIDLGLAQDRILLTANYVNNRSSNQLLPYALPGITGFLSVIQNFPATIENTAWEFSINTTNTKTGDFTWTSFINLTIPSNKLISFPNLETSNYASSLVIGQPVSIKKVYPFSGVDPVTGVFLVSDQNGKPTLTPDPSKDNISLINTLPKYYGGFQNTFSYKSFELDLLFQFVKQIGYNGRFGAVPAGFRRYNQPESVLNHWQKPGDIASYQRYNSDQSLFDPFNNVLASDAAFSDASYIRLKNLSISYRLPASWQSKSPLLNCQVYVQCQNLLTITNYEGLDPENQLGGLPPLRMLTLGLRASF